MNSRTWLALLLSMAVWFGYLKFFAPPTLAPVEKAQVAAPENQSLSPTGAASGESTAASTTSAATPTRPFATSLGRDGDAILTASSTDHEVRFSRTGGRPVGVVLKSYRSQPDAKAPPIELLGDSASTTFATVFTDPSLSGLTSQAYSANAKSAGTREFHATAAGVEITKQYVIPEKGYFSNLDLTLSFPTGSKREWGQLLIPIGAVNPQYDASAPLKAWEGVAYQSDKLTRHATEKIEAGEQVLQGSTDWIAYGNKYFAMAATHKEGINPDVVFHRSAEFTGVALRYPLVLKEGQNQLSLKLQLYAGPKDIGALSAVPTMRSLVDYTFKAVAIPLLEILRFFYKYTHNYGIAIILLTLLVRLIFYPLSLKSFRSMRNMQKLQPQIAALKEKFGDDREKFSREQLALFKAHKVNPASGCLPIFIQLPVFIALYAVLGNSMELFQAPFFGWLHDLSSKDPYYVLPILMGIAMVVQQKITPSVGMDPMQQKMMMLMPVVFTFMMVNLPSGLTLYMFVSTLLGILQQMLMSRESKPAPVTVPVQVPEKN